MPAADAFQLRDAALGQREQRAQQCALHGPVQRIREPLGVVPAVGNVRCRNPGQVEHHAHRGVVDQPGPGPGVGYALSVQRPGKSRREVRGSGEDCNLGVGDLLYQPEAFDLGGYPVVFGGLLVEQIEVHLPGMEGRGGETPIVGEQLSGRGQHLCGNPETSIEPEHLRRRVPESGEIGGERLDRSPLGAPE